MRLTLWLVVLFILAVTLTLLAEYNLAYTLIVWPPYRVQISLNLLVLLLFAGFSLLYAITRMVARILELPAAVATFRERQRREGATQAFGDAVCLFYEGRYGQALKQAEKAYPDVIYPGIAALLAAKSAHAMHNRERKRHWLDLAVKHDKDVRKARLMVEAELAIADRRYDDATRALDMLRAQGQRHIAALRLGLQLEQNRGRWDEVARLARQLRKVNALSHDQAAPLIRRAMIERLREADSDLPNLQRLWHEIPAEDRKDAGFLERAVPYLVGAGDESLAHVAIENALAEEWSSELAALYGRCKSDDLRRQLSMAESWLREHPNDADLLLALGRLCLRAQLWGKAKSYFEASLSRRISRVAHLELAKLADMLENVEEANRHYREAASLGA